MPSQCPVAPCASGRGHGGSRGDDPGSVPFLQDVERYRRLTGLLPDLQNRLLTSRDDELLESLLNQAGERLGLLVDGQVAASAQYEIATVADHAFYDLLHEGKTGRSSGSARPAGRSPTLTRRRS